MTKGAVYDQYGSKAAGCALCGSRFQNVVALAVHVQHDHNTDWPPLPRWMPNTRREFFLCLFVAVQWFLVGLWVGWLHL